LAAAIVATVLSCSSSPCPLFLLSGICAVPRSVATSNETCAMQSLARTARERPPQISCRGVSPLSPASLLTCRRLAPAPAPSPTRHTWPSKNCSNSFKTKDRVAFYPSQFRMVFLSPPVRLAVSSAQFAARNPARRAPCTRCRPCFAYDAASRNPRGKVLDVC
jgi:hypothetical protein